MRLILNKVAHVHGENIMVEKLVPATLDGKFPVLFFAVGSSLSWFLFDFFFFFSSILFCFSFLFFSSSSCFFYSKNCWYASSFPLDGGLDGNTGGSSLLSSEAPSCGEITSVPTLSTGTFMEVSPPSLHSDSVPVAFSVPILGSSRCLDWSFAFSLIY